MVDFLTRLVQRAQGGMPILQPYVAPQFAPEPSMALPAEESLINRETLPNETLTDKTTPALDLTNQSPRLQPLQKPQEHQASQEDSQDSLEQPKINRQSPQQDTPTVLASPLASPIPETFPESLEAPSLETPILQQNQQRALPEDPEQLPHSSPGQEFPIIYPSSTIPSPNEVPLRPEVSTTQVSDDASLPSQLARVKPAIPAMHASTNASILDTVTKVEMSTETLPGDSAVEPFLPQATASMMSNVIVSDRTFQQDSPHVPLRPGQPPVSNNNRPEPRETLFNSSLPNGSPQNSGPQNDSPQTSNPQNIVQAPATNFSQPFASQPLVTRSEPTLFKPEGSDGTYAKVQVSSNLTAPKSLLGAMPPASTPSLSTPLSTSLENRTAAAPPTIDITIGRIEIRAAAPATPKPRPKARQRQAGLSLEQYLNQRNQG